MADWQVALIFQDNKSNKFWRARSHGEQLEINFGRIGTDGQSQMKNFASMSDCAKEMEKQARSKRKKGYVDDPDVSIVVAEQAPKATATAAATPQDTELVLGMVLGERKMEVKLTVDGDTVYTTVAERHSNTTQAQRAFDSLREAMEAEGYQRQ